MMHARFSAVARLFHLLLGSTCLLVGPARATIFIGGTITTSGGQVYASPVVLTNDTALNSTGGGDITFASTVDGGFSLAVNTGGITSFSGAVGAATAWANLA